LVHGGRASPRWSGRSTPISWSTCPSFEREFLDHSAQPDLLERIIQRERPKTVFIDEVQRLPTLLNTVQGLLDALTVDFAVSRADRSTVIVTRACGRWRLPRRPPSPALVMSAPVEGQSVVAPVDPVRDTTAAVTMAMSLAARLSAARVVVCRVFFDEAAAACDAWEQRALDAETERLDIYLARVPIDADVAVVPRVLQSPYVDRSIARVAADERAALVVSATRLAADVPVLTLPEEVVRRPLPPSGLVGLWQAFLDGPNAVPA
jgi:hypothetical protein